MLKDNVECFKKYRTTGFKNAIITDKELAAELNVEPEFTPAHLTDENWKDSLKVPDEEIQEISEKKFEINFFHVLLDTVLNTLEERFKLWNNFVEKWSFLFDLKKLPEKATFWNIVQISKLRKLKIKLQISEQLIFVMNY